MIGFLAAVALAQAQLLASAGGMSGDVQVSACQGHLLAAWREENVVAAAVDGKRTVLGTTARGVPAVACGRTSWLVVWPSDEFGVDARRVALDGALAAPQALFRGPFGAADVAAAYGDDRFLVAWADGVTIRAMPVDEAGAALGPVRAANVEAPFVAPRIVWTGTAFFVGWAEDRGSPLSPRPTRFWGTRVSPSGTIEPTLTPLIESGAGLRGLQPSVTANGEQITFAWVAEHGAQTCVDVATPNAAPRSVRCSDADDAPVLDEAEIRFSRGELVLVWRELRRTDFSSRLYAIRLDRGDAPALVAERAWGIGLTSTPAGVGIGYFAASPPPNEVNVGVYLREIEQGPAPPAPGRKRAVRR